MDDETRKAHVRASLETPAPPDVLGTMVARLWPGGPADRSAPSAREWLRRWAPKREVAEPVVCGCAAGRCAVCN